jgi:AcrR family transcriptional regulator
VKAAIEVVARRGFHAATVDEVARRAGFSIGALYSNFTGKDELFLAVFDEHIAWFEGQLEKAARADDAAVAASEWMALLTRNPQQFLVFVEFWAYAVRKPKVRPKFARRMARMREAIAEAVGEKSAASGRAPAVPPETAALLLLATGRGLGLEKLADPESFSDDVVEQLVRGFMG